MRCSSDSAVSLLRVCSDRYSEKPGASSASEGKVFCQRFNRIAHQFGGQVRGIGAKRSHSKRPAATCQQHSGHCSGDALGVFWAVWDRRSSKARLAVVKP